ncbi:PepSY domain-containing protein [Comamonas sp. Tr-654]|uniref:PepSY-associated TM helix domain-containing protein n=1 Tax=Comamonas sp. Tr-654 TaxID=2608341 RepID=UPI0014240324|nr:PepSY-associated TM helix domain-containing protein [Comamonas sp. Tr-654]NIF85807.1 PepSY domain-containing protein [Comamonas sp. Tr-654]
MTQQKVNLGAAQGSFRQAQAWLHTWCGLWVSWLLFAILLTGTLAVFKEPITHWMTPEHHAEEAAEEEKTPHIPAEGDRARRLAFGLAYMEKHHPGAEMWELWPSNAEGAGHLIAYWFDSKREYAAARLDPLTGEVVAPVKPRARSTQGGHHFVEFHHNLHAGQPGLWVVGMAALAMLVALVSGVITHRRIFKDFFTLRIGKGQRSWLDAHNIAGVLTLPFQLMIAYTGIMISAAIFMPSGVLTFFGKGSTGAVAFETAVDDAGKPARSGVSMAVPELEAFASRGQQLIRQPVRAVVIDHPGDAAARIGVYGWNADDELLDRLSATTGRVLFSAATGEVLSVRQPGAVGGGSVALAQSAMIGLHKVKFGGLMLKWLYFFCGLAGSAMVATGAILFTVKRRTRHLGEFGSASTRLYSLIEGLNTTAIAGVPLACVGYLWGNRLIPVEIAHRRDWELAMFFGLWLLSLIHAVSRDSSAVWKEQLAALATLCFLLPLLNWLTVGDHLVAQIQRGDWESAGVELFVILFGVASTMACRSLCRRASGAARTSVAEASV